MVRVECVSLTVRTHCARGDRRGELYERVERPEEEVFFAAADFFAGDRFVVLDFFVVDDRRAGSGSGSSSNTCTSGGSTAASRGAGAGGGAVPRLPEAPDAALRRAVSGFIPPKNPPAVSASCPSGCIRRATSPTSPRTD
jgi:hypothetical protein